MSSFSHEEAVRVLSQASQPIMVEVRQREPTEPLQSAPVRTSQEQSVQTEPELGNFCDSQARDQVRDQVRDQARDQVRDQVRDQATSHTYYDFNKEEENFIYPELQYEVSSEP